ncbi:hypothetical protein P5V15_009242 [Pogonomyrmex californicus]
MAPGKASVASAGSETGKVGSKELRQRKLLTEDSVSGKKVTFKMTGAGEEKSGEWKNEWLEFRGEWLKEVKELREEKKLREMERDKNRESEWEERFRDMGERLGSVERQIAGTRESMSGGEGDGESSRSGGSWRTRGSGCSRLSEREVNKEKMGKIREVEENKIVWVENFIEKELGIECKIKMCRINKAVVIAKVEGEEKKWEIMTNKSKLRGGRIYIENDLSWEERKIQERIQRYKRKQKEKGLEVKIGTGRIKMDSGILEKLGRDRRGNRER